MVALMAAIFVITATSSAFALSGYADRKSTFFGLGVGGGFGQLAQDDSDSDREAGLHVNGMLGHGLSKNMIAGVQTNGWMRNVQIGDHTSFHQHWNFLAAGNFYLVEGLYLEAGTGLAYAAFDFASGSQTEKYREMGFALRGGVGYEHFINGTHAMGAKVGYTRHFYADADFDTLSVGVTFRWYGL